MGTRILISITEVRRDTARLFEQVRVSTRPHFVTQYGYITAVLLSPREYETLRAAAQRHDRRIEDLLNGLRDWEMAQLAADKRHEE